MLTNNMFYALERQYQVHNKRNIIVSNEQCI